MEKPMTLTDPLNPQLSAHFDLMTLCQSETALEQGIYNMPREVRVIANLTALCTHVLEPLIDHFDLPLNVTSGYRCPQLNAAVGGIEGSQHITGEAVDIMMGGLRNDELARWIIDNLPFDEVILEKFDPRVGEYGWVHVSYVEGANRGKVTTFDGQTYHEGFHYFDLSGQ